MSVLGQPAALHKKSSYSLGSMRSPSHELADTPQRLMLLSILLTALSILGASLDPPNSSLHAQAQVMDRVFNEGIGG